MPRQISTFANKCCQCGYFQPIPLPSMDGCALASSDRGPGVRWLDGRVGISPVERQDHAQGNYDDRS
jgi:hypothetical protein